MQACSSKGYFLRSIWQARVREYLVCKKKSQKQSMVNQNCCIKVKIAKQKKITCTDFAMKRMLPSFQSHR